MSIFNELEAEIESLIQRHTEGSYWDFKRQWHENNCDLLHDIICMANSLTNRDCYIIIGVEDESYTLCGVRDENRKNQQNVLNLLHQGKCKWSGACPEVYVRTILISNTELDVIIIKQSYNTPFFLIDDYSDGQKFIRKGAIYTRIGDTNTPKNATANMYDCELLWKKRFGLLLNPSQRANNYLNDLENWEYIDEECFFYYKPDPDYTVHLINENTTTNTSCFPKIDDINDKSIGPSSYYLYSFSNIWYHTYFSNNKEVVLKYKNIPLFSSYIESIDEGRANIVPPQDSPYSLYYIEGTLRFSMFSFIFYHLGEVHLSEAKKSILRVVPVYCSNEEREEFMRYILERGYPVKTILKPQISIKQNEYAIRFKKTIVYNFHDSNYSSTFSYKEIAQYIKENPNLVINFAAKSNRQAIHINTALKRGKILVDWLKDWRINM